IHNNTPHASAQQQFKQCNSRGSSLKLSLTLNQRSIYREGATGFNFHSTEVVFSSNNHQHHPPYYYYYYYYYHYYHDYDVRSCPIFFDREGDVPRAGGPGHHHLPPTPTKLVRFGARRIKKAKKKKTQKKKLVEGRATARELLEEAERLEKAAAAEEEEARRKRASAASRSCGRAAATEKEGGGGGERRRKRRVCPSASRSSLRP
ncbi:hypothetical protein ASPBRDRAFT_67589, partial [Aspergillus brasiliensis CBS 101740]